MDRYRGSVLGISWVLLYPLALVGVYTFVFGTVLSSRWAESSGANALPFSINVFSGLLIFLVVADVVSRAPASISSQLAYVKKVKFPLWLLGIVDVAIALLNAVAGTVVMVCVSVTLGVPFQMGLFWIGCLFLTMLPFLVGLHWLIGAITVYVRDLEQLVPPALTFLLFLSPVFYSLDAVSVDLRELAFYNPLTIWIEIVRGLMGGIVPDHLLVALWWVILVSSSFGFASWCVFRRLSKGFPDAI